MGTALRTAASRPLTTGLLLLETPGHRWVLERSWQPWALSWHKVADLPWQTGTAPAGVGLVLRTPQRTVILGQAWPGCYTAWSFLPGIRYAALEPPA